MKKRITLKLIAKEFNVSIATISKALSDSYEISTGVKDKIQKYAKEHNYKPNSIGITASDWTKICEIQSCID